MVAKKVRDTLPLLLCAQWKTESIGDQSSLGNTENAPGSTDIEENASPSMNDECYETLEVEANEKLPDMCIPLEHSMLKAFKLMDKELKLHPTIDCFCSGTTAVTLIKQVFFMQLSTVFLNMNRYHHIQYDMSLNSA